MLPVVILAGGLATRMKPMTEKIPKSLIELKGKPFIIHQLSYIKSQGIQKIVLCIGHLGHMIQSLIGNGEALGLDIQYSLDGDKLLATTPNKSVKEKIVDYKVLSGKLVPGQMTAVVDVNKKTLTLYSGQTLVGVIGE
jgi:NDP-sugar pyrophosphorylase family protein